MTTYTYVGTAGLPPSGDSWSVAANWAGGVVPSTSADVSINGSEVTAAAAYTVNSISITGDGVLNLTGGALTVESSVDNAGAGLWGAQAQLTCDGAFTNASEIQGRNLIITSASFYNTGTLDVLANGAADYALTLNVASGGFANLIGGTLTGGEYDAGFDENDGWAPQLGSTTSTLYLNVGGAITTLAANMGIYMSGAIEVFDPATSAYVPIQSMLQAIAASGTLSLQNGTNGFGNLTVDGKLELLDAQVSVQQLTIDPGGVVEGYGSISGPVLNNGVIHAGTLGISGPVTGTGVFVIESGAGLELGAAASQNVVFSDTHGTLVLGDPSHYSGTITLSPGAGDQIQLSGIPRDSVVGESYAGDYQGGTLTLNLASGSSVDLHVAGGLFDAQSFALIGDTKNLLITVKGITTPPSDQLRDDFAGAGVSNLLLENNGDVFIGQFSGGQETYAKVGHLGSEWSFYGTGDLLNDGKDQFLIENTSGLVCLGEIANGTTAYTKVGALGAEWRLEGVGDFQGSGFDQFLLENSSGQVDLGSVVGGQTTYTKISAIGSEWTFEGVGAFLGTDKADYLVENAKGQLAIGEIESVYTGETPSMRPQPVYVPQLKYFAIGGIGPEWKIVETGAFQGAGRSGFLLENTFGQVVVGEVGANGLAQFTKLAALGPEWKFVGAGDYLGEGHDQFVIENTSGLIEIGDDVNGQVQFTKISALGHEWSFHS